VLHGKVDNQLFVIWSVLVALAIALGLGAAKKKVDYKSQEKCRDQIITPEQRLSPYALDCR